MNTETVDIEGVYFEDTLSTVRRSSVRNRRRVKNMNLPADVLTLLSQNMNGSERFVVWIKSIHEIERFDEPIIRTSFTVCRL